MFFGNFAEKKKKIVEIKDVDRQVWWRLACIQSSTNFQEFVELLKVIYPSQDKITGIEYFLRKWTSNFRH